MSVYFTSDLHLGHRLVAHLRGFGDSRETADTDAHDKAVGELWDGIIRPSDVVWVLGDLALNKPPIDWIAQRPGRKRLIFGNHDPGHPMHSRSPKVWPEYLRAFEYVAPFARVKVCGEPVLLSHFPYSDEAGADRGEYAEPRYMQYRLPNKGEWLLHGHTHGPERRHGRQIHVGLDAWDLTPVRDDQVHALRLEA